MKQMQAKQSTITAECSVLRKIRIVGCSSLNPERSLSLWTILNFSDLSDGLASRIENVLKTQQRLLTNNYVPLDEEEIRKIYQALY